MVNALALSLLKEGSKPLKREQFKVRSTKSLSSSGKDDNPNSGVLVKPLCGGIASHNLLLSRRTRISELAIGHQALARTTFI